MNYTTLFFGFLLTLVGSFVMIAWLIAVVKGEEANFWVLLLLGAMPLSFGLILLLRLFEIV